MASKKYMDDDLDALQVIISVDHKYDINNRKLIRTVLKKKGYFDRDKYNKIFSTVILQSLTYIFN